MKSSIPAFLAFYLCIVLCLPARANYFEEGKKYYIYKQFDKAREMFLKRLDAGDHGDTLYFLGEIEKLQENFIEAEDYFRRAAATPGTTKKYRVNAFWNVIILAEQRGDYVAVIRACKEMWLGTRDEGAKNKIESIINKYLWSSDEEAIASYKKGIELKEKGDRDAALDCFRDALYQDRSFLAPKFEIGMSYYKNGDMGNASYYFSDIATRIPFYSEVQLLMGNIQFNRKYYSSALEYFARALEYGLLDNATEYQVLIKKAHCNYDLGHYDEALADIDRSRKLRPTNLDPLMLEAAILIKRENYDDALAALQKAESLKPDNPTVLFQIGSIYYNRKDWRHLSYFDRVHALAHKAKETQKYQRIYPILIAGHFEKKNYSKIVQLADEMPEGAMDYATRRMLAHASYHLGRYDAAIDMFEKISLNAADQALLCGAYARSGREDAAIDLIDRHSYNEEFMKETRADPLLSRMLARIDKERREKEERLKREEELRRIEEERRRSEEDMRRREEERRLQQEREARERQMAAEESERLSREHRAHEQPGADSNHGGTRSGADADDSTAVPSDSQPGAREP
jgi:tetratricopeptide (TPR) repeat protein